MRWMSSSEAQRTRPLSATIAVLLTGTAAAMAAFLIAFGLIQSCSAANIAIFLAVLGVSAALGFAGTIVAGVSYRKTKHRLALVSMLLTVLYAALLIYLVKLIEAA